jgi:hypothetical protein
MYEVVVALAAIAAAVRLKSGIKPLLQQEYSLTEVKI